MDNKSAMGKAAQMPSSPKTKGNTSINGMRNSNCLDMDRMSAGTALPTAWKYPEPTTWNPTRGNTRITTLRGMGTYLQQLRIIVKDGNHGIGEEHKEDKSQSRYTHSHLYSRFQCQPHPFRLFGAEIVANNRL